MPPPSYGALLAARPWRALRHCPGRSVWTGSSRLTPTDLAGPSAVARVFQVSAAPDPVHVIALPEGGLISYQKPDGGFVHTLNTPEGFARKLHALGISIDRVSTGPDRPSP